MNSKFTVNYGLRWDYFSLMGDDNWEQANFVPGPPGQARYRQAGTRFATTVTEAQTKAQADYMAAHLARTAGATSSSTSSGMSRTPPATSYRNGRGARHGRVGPLAAGRE